MLARPAARLAAARTSRAPARRNTVSTSVTTTAPRVARRPTSKRAPAGTAESGRPAPQAARAWTADSAVEPRLHTRGRCDPNRARLLIHPRRELRDLLIL